MVKVVQIKPLDGLPEGAVRELESFDFNRLKAFGAVREATEEEWNSAVVRVGLVGTDGLDAMTIEELGEIARAEKIEPTADEMKAHVVSIIRSHRHRATSGTEKDVRRVAEGHTAGADQGAASSSTDASKQLGDSKPGEAEGGAKAAPAVRNKAAPPVAQKAQGETATTASDGDLASSDQDA